MSVRKKDLNTKLHEYIFPKAAYLLLSSCPQPYNTIFRLKGESNKASYMLLYALEVVMSWNECHQDQNDKFSWHSFTSK